MPLARRARRRCAGARPSRRRRSARRCRPSRRSKSRPMRSAMVRARSSRDERMRSVIARSVGIVGIDEVGEHMHAAPFVLRRELHSRNERHAEGCRRLGRIRPSRCRVVVGERRRAQAVPVRGRHDLRGRLRAVGVDRMQVQVARPLEASRVRHPSSVARGVRPRAGVDTRTHGRVRADRSPSLLT